MSLPTSAIDPDPLDTREWLESLSSMVAHAGRDRGLSLLDAQSHHARELGLSARAAPYSAYRNTIPIADKAVHSGDVAMEERLTASMRWSALAMVVGANHDYGELRISG